MLNLFDYLLRVSNYATSSDLVFCSNFATDIIYSIFKRLDFGYLLIYT